MCSPSSSRGAPRVHPQALDRPRRLTRSGDFAETYRQGRRWAGRCMVLWVRRGPGASLRLGVVASRKVGPAVSRARAKRRLREVFRRQRGSLAGAADVVLVARAAVLTASWKELQQECMNLAQRAGLAGTREDTGSSRAGGPRPS